MKVCLVQSLIGAGGGNDVVLKQMLNSLKENDITVYTNTKPLIKIDQKVETKLPIKLPYFGLYQQLLGWKTPENFKRFDIIIVLSGNMVINTTGKKMYHYNQNNFGDVTENTISKYKSGVWSLYYLPFKLSLNSLQKKIKNSNIEFIANSKYTGNKMMQKYGKETRVIYPPVNLKEFKNLPKKKQVITIARFSKEKNLDEAVKIMSYLLQPYYIYGTSKSVNMLYYETLKQKITPNIELCNNRPRGEMIEKLAESKVYLHTSIETFGISVVEAMASGCIPIVPNNSANTETVPFGELRYNTQSEAIDKVRNALDGYYDYILPILQTHIQQFDVSKFNHEINKLISIEK
jgi:glycosyltransferase involved in cell wall biosynthesis